MKRILDCSCSDFAVMSKKDILESIAASEGRVIVSEIIGMLQPVLVNISNAELSAAFGSDILLLNMFDLDNPVFNGIPPVPKDDIPDEIKKLTGRLLGINLEPVDENQETIGEILSIPNGRKATLKNAAKAVNMGFNMIVLTGNPGTSVSNKEILSSLETISSKFKDNVILAAGKMHARIMKYSTVSNIFSINSIFI